MNIFKKLYHKLFNKAKPTSTGGMVRKETVDHILNNLINVQTITAPTRQIYTFRVQNPYCIWCNTLDCVTGRHVRNLQEKLTKGEYNAYKRTIYIDPSNRLIQVMEDDIFLLECKYIFSNKPQAKNYFKFDEWYDVDASIASHINYLASIPRKNEFLGRHGIVFTS